MKEEQFNKAQQIVKRIAALTFKKNQLEQSLKNGVKSVYIEAIGNNSAGEYRLKNYNDDHDTIDNQPKSISVLLDAFVQTSIAVYQREINDLEREFNSL